MLKTYIAPLTADDSGHGDPPPKKPQRAPAPEPTAPATPAA